MQTAENTSYISIAEQLKLPVSSPKHPDNDNRNQRREHEAIRLVALAVSYAFVSLDRRYGMDDEKIFENIARMGYLIQSRLTPRDIAAYISRAQGTIPVLIKKEQQEHIMNVGGLSIMATAALGLLVRETGRTPESTVIRTNAGTMVDNNPLAQLIVSTHPHLFVPFYRPASRTNDKIELNYVESSPIHPHSTGE